MNFNHKPGISFRICLVLIFFLLACSLIISSGSMLYADDENKSEEIAQNTDDEKITEEMAKKIKELEVITIDNKGYAKDRKGPAEFEHVKHAREYKISCWECHHEYKDKDAKQDEQAKQPEQVAQTEQNEQNGQAVEKKKIIPKEQSELNIWSPWGITKKCAECHDPKEKKDDVIKLQAAYHKNCKTCHVERRIFGNDVLAYRKCTSCHK